MKVAVFLSSVGAAAAFVQGPSLLSTRRAAAPGLRMNVSPFTEELLGKPFGQDGPVFDPFGLSGKATNEELRKYREAELKHGRVCMLGAVGLPLQEVFHPLFLTNSDLGPAIYHFQEIQARFPVFWLITLLVIGITEGETIGRGWVKQDPLVDGVANLRDDYIEGDLGLDPLKLKDDPAAFESYRTKELNNGRLAMIAFAGQIAQELVDKQGILAHLQLA